MSKEIETGDLLRKIYKEISMAYGLEIFRLNEVIRKVVEMIENCRSKRTDLSNDDEYKQILEYILSETDDDPLERPHESIMKKFTEPVNN